MNPILKVTVAGVVALQCALTFGCSQKKIAENRYTESKSESSASAQRAAKNHLHLAEIDYQSGVSVLTAGDKAKIRDLLRTASSHGEVDQIKVLAWADRDYASTDRKPSSAEMRLADARASVIEDFIQDQLDFDDVDTHNMANDPGAWGRMFNTDDYQLKSGVYENDGRVFTPTASPHKAVVMIEMERQAYRAD